MTSAVRVSVQEFNDMSESRRISLLLGVCTSDTWAQRVLAGGPFDDAGTLIEHAERVLAGLSETDVDAALSGHPRIGDRPDNASSAREQAAVTTAGDEFRAQLALRNAEYENRFGHVYLVCASGRSAPELLVILTERLGNDPVTERRVMRAELAKINRLRLERLFTEPLD